MSSRALRKRQQQLPTLDNHELDEEIQLPTQRNVFDLLDQDQIAESSADDSEPAAEELLKPVIKRGKKKKKKAMKAAVASPQSDGDELERALEELEVSHPLADIIVPDTSLAAPDILLIDTRKMDAELELRRQFPHLRAQTKKRARFVLVKPRDDWPRFNSAIHMEVLDRAAQAFSLVHPKSYQKVQTMFYQAVETHNPDQLTYLSQSHPFHIDTLLQLSLVARYNGNMDQAHELVERALYVFEKSLHSLFNIQKGLCRLSFDRMENRPIYLALYRHADLDLTDPLATVITMDFYSVKAQEFEWYTQFYNYYRAEMKLDMYPNSVYGVAMCTYELETLQNQTHRGSTALLADAINRFPAVVTGIYEKLQIKDKVLENPLFSQHESSPKAFKSILQDLYVQNSHTLWKIPDLLSWLKQTANEAIAQTKLQTDVQIEVQLFYGAMPLPMNISRFVIITENQDFIPRIPSHKDINSYDPLPPITAITSIYDRERYARVNPPGTTIPNDAGQFQAFILSLLPWLHPAEMPPGFFEGGEAAVLERVRTEVANVPLEEGRQGIFALLDWFTNNRQEQLEVDDQEPNEFAE